MSAAETWIPAEMVDVAMAAYAHAVGSAAHRDALREALLAGFMFAGRVEVWATHNHQRGDSMFGVVKHEMLAGYPVTGDPEAEDPFAAPARQPEGN